MRTLPVGSFHWISFSRTHLRERDSLTFSTWAPLGCAFPKVVASYTLIVDDRFRVDEEQRDRLMREGEVASRE